MKLLIEDAEFRNFMTTLGDTFQLSPSTLEKGEQAICTLYKSKLKRTNHVRNERWNRSTKDITKLPPTQDSAIQQLKRANYQAHGHGWEVTGDNISFVWMTQPSGPDIITKKKQEVWL